MSDKVEYGVQEIVVNEDHPWNNKYNIKEDVITFANSRLDWKVNKSPLYVPDREQTGWYKTVKGHSLLYREDTGGHLAIAKDSYGIIQNKVLWESLEEALAGIKYEIVSAGYVQGGRKLFIQARVDDENFTVNGDKFTNLIGAWTSHDGSSGYELMDNATRNVCRNTTTTSYREGGKVFNLKVRHTKNAVARIDGLMQNLEEIFDHRKKFFADLQELASMEVRPQDALAFSAGFFHNSKNKEISTNALNKAKKVVSLFNNGVGNRGETGYDLFNGFTEYYTHGNREACEQDEVRRNKQFYSSERGANARAKAHVLDVLMDEQKRNRLFEIGTAVLS
jgi:phage/plasmid-like protein (TIGR03299 family)